VLLSLILLLSLSLLKSQLGQYDVVKVYKPSASACLFAAAASLLLLPHAQRESY